MAGRPLGDDSIRHVHAHLSEDVARQARMYAKQTGMSLSSLVESALRLYLVRVAFFEKLELESLIESVAADVAEQLRAQQGGEV